MKKMIAYCGLDCEKCDAYLATVHNDDALREKTAKLWAEMKGPANIIIWDEVGGYPNISTDDVYQTNSLIHVIDRVLMPK